MEPTRRLLKLEEGEPDLIKEEPANIFKTIEDQVNYVKS